METHLLESFGQLISAGGRALHLLIVIAAWLSVPSVLLQRRGRAVAGLAWILVLLAFPSIGLILWWALGRPYLTRKKRKRFRAMARMEGKLTSLRERLEPVPVSIPAPLMPLRNLLEDDATGIFSPASGNRVLPLPDCAEAFNALEEAINRASHHVHLLFYIWQPDESGRRFRDLLVAKARQGVEVRVMYDAIGSSGMTASFMMPLTDAGGKVAAFLPVVIWRRRPTWNFRNHRKIVVADARVAITGSFNIGDEYLEQRRDLGVVLEGPAVRQLQEVFADDWFFVTGEDLALPQYFQPPASWSEPWLPPAEAYSASCAVIASGPDRRHNATHDAFFLAITTAKKRVVIITPYFIPDSATLMALRSAVLRGVDVQILLPHKSDITLTRWASRSYYPELIASNIRIFEYVGRFLHSKCLIFDDEMCVLGSANLDSRSFLLSFEASVFLYSAEVNRRMVEIYENELRSAIEITEYDVRRAGLAQQLGDAFANLLAPLL